MEPSRKGSFSGHKTIASSVRGSTVMRAGGSHYTYVKYKASLVSTYQVCDAPLSNSGLLSSTRIQRCHLHDSNVTTPKIWSKRTWVQAMLEFYRMPSLTHEPSGQYPAQKALGYLPRLWEWQADNDQITWKITSRMYTVRSLKADVHLKNDVRIRNMSKFVPLESLHLQSTCICYSYKSTPVNNSTRY